MQQKTLQVFWGRSSAASNERGHSDDPQALLIRVQQHFPMKSTRNQTDIALAVVACRDPGDSEK
jgi:hypothetical protein